MDRGYVVTRFRIAVLRTKKELPVSEYIDRSYVVTRRRRVVVVSLISHPWGDSSAPYLSTAILTILCFRYLFAKPSEQEYTLNRPPPCETDID